MANKKQPPEGGAPQHNGRAPPNLYVLRVLDPDRKFSIGGRRESCTRKNQRKNVEQSCAGIRGKSTFPIAQVSGEEQSGKHMEGRNICKSQGGIGAVQDRN